MELFIEIRAAEGGDDAVDLVTIQTGLYGQTCKRYGL